MQKKTKSNEYLSLPMLLRTLIFRIKNKQVRENVIINTSKLRLVYERGNFCL